MATRSRYHHWMRGNPNEVNLIFDHITISKLMML